MRTENQVCPAQKDFFKKIKNIFLTMEQDYTYTEQSHCHFINLLLITKIYTFWIFNKLQHFSYPQLQVLKYHYIHEG